LVTLQPESVPDPNTPAAQDDAASDKNIPNKGCLDLRPVSAIYPIVHMEQRYRAMESAS
jgi:hypothetical protein